MAGFLIIKVIIKLIRKLSAVYCGSLNFTLLFYFHIIKFTIILKKVLMYSIPAASFFIVLCMGDDKQ